MSLDVCVGALYFHPTYAGPAVRFRRYAPGFRKRGVDMRVFSGAFEESTGIAGAGRLPTVVVDESIAVDRVRLSHASRDRLWTYANALERYCAEDPPDVLQIFASTWEMVPGLARIRRAGVPVVYTDTLMLNELSPNPLKRLAQQVYWAGPFRHADAVVVSSGRMRDALRALGLSGPIHVIPNGVDLGTFFPAQSAERIELRRRLQLPADGEIVVYVGSLSRRKGVDLLLEAWRTVADAFPHAHLVLVGPGRSDIRPWEDADDFEQKVRRLLDAPENSESVHLTGAVDNVAEYLRAADLFVFPSAREGMPNVVLEAYASGLPSVLTPFRGLPTEFGQPGREFLLVERTATAIGEGLAGLLASPEQRSALARNALALVREAHPVERSLDAYTNLYRALAARA